MTTAIKVKILDMKMRGLSPHEIAKRLDVSYAEVVKVDKDIKKLFAKGDAQQLSEMNPDELKVAAELIATTLPYMKQSLEVIQKETKSLKSLHVTYLTVAEKTINIIAARLDDPKLSLAELERLTDMFNTSYATLYNKNGIQIINLLSTEVNTEATEDEIMKDELRLELANRKGLGNIIEAEIE